MLDQGPMLIDALQALYPSRQWTVRGNVYEGIVWEDDESIPRPTKELVEAKFKELVDAQPLKELRQERNRRLADVDWIFSEDYAIDDESYQQWLAYRKALRDLPSTTEDPVNPTWPEKPETPTGTTTIVNIQQIASENVSLRKKVTGLERKAASQELSLIELRKRVEKLGG